MHKRHLNASALLASALVLTACGNGGSDTAGNGGSSAAAETAKGNDADIAFLTGMKPHHEQAVEMSEMVPATDPPADVAAIAGQIKSAQSPEIEQMETMLADLGEKADGAAHSGGKAGHRGMMSDADMDALMDATGADAARRYLEGMVKHHQGAIEASDSTAPPSSSRRRSRRRRPPRSPRCRPCSRPSSPGAAAPETYVPGAAAQGTVSAGGTRDRTDEEAPRARRAARRAARPRRRLGGRPGPAAAQRRRQR